MSKPQVYRAKVSEHILMNESFRYLHFELIEPYKMEFKSGQYVSIDIGEGERRSYSIASAPAVDHAVEICVDITPGGKGSVYLKNLKPGDEVSFLGPLGQFELSDNIEAEKKLLLVATGSGIAPLRSMILHLLETEEDKREMRLYWGLRQVQDMFWEDDFRLRHQAFNNFHYRLLLSQPPEFWPLESGYVTKEIEDLNLDESWGVYVCGNPKMQETMIKLAEEKKVPKEQIHFEKFF